MTKAKHTPGPWKAHPIQSFQLPFSAVTAKTLLAKVYSEALGDYEESEANARLIAAAPELLEFAKEWLDRQGTDKNYMVAKARAAIAKATREQA